MATTYVDLATLHVPATSGIAPVAWGLQIRENLEALIDPPACSVYNSAAVSVPSGTVTIMSANSELFDNDASHSTVSNTSRITAQKAGRYEIAATIEWAANATGQRAISFLVNGTTVYAGQQDTTNIVGSANTVFTTERKIVLAAGDYVECRTLQTSGGNLNTTLLEFAATFRTR